jgi:hypothetical protein
MTGFKIKCRLTIVKIEYNCKIINSPLSPFIFLSLITVLQCGEFNQYTSSVFHETNALLHDSHVTKDAHRSIVPSGPQMIQ